MISAKSRHFWLVRRTLALALGASLLLMWTQSTASAAGEGPDCNLVGANDTTPVTGGNGPFDRLQIAAVQQAVGGKQQAGRGIDVVIVDAGFTIGADTTADAPAYRGGKEVAIPHAQVVAGIIGSPDQPATKAAAAVPIGYAPAARLHSVRVYESIRNAADTGSTDVAPPDSAVLASGLTAVAQRMRSGKLGRRTIAVVPFVVRRTPALVAAVKQLQDAGALVVASAGDRPAAPTGSPLDGFTGEDGLAFGQDAKGLAWPAAAPGVLAVGVDPEEAPTQPNAPSTLLPNSDIDLVAPVSDGVSIGDSGLPCRINAPSADWASAEVAGVAALVWSRYDVSATQLRSRLQQTADGPGVRTGRLSGFGVMQPMSALQRRSGSWDRSGARAATETVPRAIAPEQPADVLAETRRHTVWWGLIGGGLIAIALVLRPLRRR